MTHNLEKNAQQIAKIVRRGDLHRALIMVYEAVLPVVRDPKMVSKDLSFPKFDRLCQEIGLRTYKENNVVNPNVFVYITTLLDSSGGHTRVLSELIRARPDVQHYILSTELCGPSNIEYINKLFCEELNAKFFPSPQKEFGDCMLWLQQKLVDISPEKVYLFNHYQDSVAIAAVQERAPYKLSFYHHTDYNLCLGASLNIEHIDFHPHGYNRCRTKEGLKNSYLPLTVTEPAKSSSGYEFMSDGKLRTCTASGFTKIEGDYFISYFDVIPKLLAATGGKHIHIGRLPKTSLFYIKHNLKQNGCDPSQFIYVPWVASVWQALQEHKIDYYIASFPYGGGLTFVESMGAGVPAALHQNIEVELLGSISMAYPGAFIWQDPDELIEYCCQLTKSSLEEHSKLAREQYLRHHCREAFDKALSEINACKSITYTKNGLSLSTKAIKGLQLKHKRVYNRLVGYTLRKLDRIRMSLVK